MADSIIIIGAGIAGLAAGCYGQMNGYRTRIFEMHELPGGLCTSWERKGYVIDGCIHYLFGSGPGQPYHQLWQELGVAGNTAVIDHEELMRVVDAQGRALIAYADPDRWEAHMKELSPRDADLIEDLVDGVRRFREFDLSALQAKPRSLMAPTDWLAFNRAVLPYTLPMAKWGRVTAREYADRFEDPFLRRAFAQIFGWPDIPVMAGLQLLAYMANGNAGFPVGGSLAFARAVAARYEALGGQIEYKAQVERILVEDGRAVGIRLYDDREFRADIVISAADGRGTVFDMLGGEFADRQIRRFYDGRLPIRSQVQVSLGVARDLAAEPHWVIYLLDQPVRIADQERSEIGVKHYCFDPSLTPAGKSVVEVMMPSHYGYWQRIYGRRLYDTEQLQVADKVIEFLEGVYPGIRQQIEVKDVATPLSYERFTGNWLGATTGWLLTEKTMPILIQGMPKTLPDLERFYMCGQWVEPGGMVPTAGMSGRNVMQLICAADDRPFATDASLLLL